MQKLTASTVFDFLRGKKLALIGLGAVSYTHLTLPTKA